MSLTPTYTMSHLLLDPSAAFLNSTCAFYRATMSMWFFSTDCRKSPGLGHPLPTWGGVRGAIAGWGITHHHDSAVYLPTHLCPEFRMQSLIGWSRRKNPGVGVEKLGFKFLSLPLFSVTVDKSFPPFLSLSSLSYKIKQG